MEGGSASPTDGGVPDRAGAALSSLPRSWMTWATRPPAAWPASAPAPSTSSRCAAIPSASTAPKKPASGATGATPPPLPPHAAVSGTGQGGDAGSAALPLPCADGTCRGGDTLPRSVPSTWISCKGANLELGFPSRKPKSRSFRYLRRGGDGASSRVPPRRH